MTTARACSRARFLCIAMRHNDRKTCGAREIRTRKSVKCRWNYLEEHYAKRSANGKHHSETGSITSFVPGSSARLERNWRSMRKPSERNCGRWLPLGTFSPRYGEPPVPLTHKQGSLPIKIANERIDQERRETKLFARITRKGAPYASTQPSNNKTKYIQFCAQMCLLSPRFHLVHVCA